MIESEVKPESTDGRSVDGKRSGVVGVVVQIVQGWHTTAGCPQKHLFNTSFN